MSYLQFIEKPNEGKKTKLWEVVNTQSASLLGHIGWYGPWRKYVFGAGGLTVFDHKCLREIADFMQTETNKHYGR